MTFKDSNRNLFIRSYLYWATRVNMSLSSIAMDGVRTAGSGAELVRAVGVPPVDDAAVHRALAPLPGPDRTTSGTESMLLSKQQEYIDDAAGVVEPEAEAEAEAEAETETEAETEPEPEPEPKAERCGCLARPDAAPMTVCLMNRCFEMLNKYAPWLNDPDVVAIAKLFSSGTFQHLGADGSVVVPLDKVKSFVPVDRLTGQDFIRYLNFVDSVRHHTTDKAQNKRFVVAATTMLDLVFVNSLKSRTASTADKWDRIDEVVNMLTCAHTNTIHETSVKTPRCRTAGMHHVDTLRSQAIGGRPRANQLLQQLQTPRSRERGPDEQRPRKRSRSAETKTNAEPEPEPEPAPAGADSEQIVPGQQEPTHANAWFRGGGMCL